MSRNFSLLQSQAIESLVIAVVTSLFKKGTKLGDGKKMDLHLVTSPGPLSDPCCGWGSAGTAKVLCLLAFREHVALARAVLWEARQLGFGLGHWQRRSRQGFLMVSKLLLWHFVQNSNN